MPIVPQFQYDSTVPSPPLARRLEDRVRHLLHQVLTATEDSEPCQRLSDLQIALHQYIERLRDRIADYVIFQPDLVVSSPERRSQDDPTSGHGTAPRRYSSPTQYIPQRENPP